MELRFSEVPIELPQKVCQWLQTVGPVRFNVCRTESDYYMNGDELAQIEYEELRHEVADSLSETRRLEIYAIGASAAFWAWTIADAPTATLASPTRWIPAVFTLLGGLRCIALLGHILDIRDYFLKIEAKFPRRLQFENHLMQQKRWFLVPVATLIWLALLVGNLYLASALPSYSHPEPPTTVCP